MRAHVVIVGAGVAGLEALPALRAVLGDRVDLTIVAPEVKFTNASMAVPDPRHPLAFMPFRYGTLRPTSPLGGTATSSTALTWIDA